MFALSIKGEIASAHYLRGYEGKCKDLHGHTWKVEVTFTGGPLNGIGMVEDFAALKMKLREFLAGIDHVCLNDLPYFKDINPTAENIAKYIYDGFGKAAAPLKIKDVRVWESDTASVTYSE